MFDDLPPDLARLLRLRTWHAVWLARIDEAARTAKAAVKNTVTTADEAVTMIPLWGDAFGSDKAAWHVLKVAHRATASAALHTTAMRAQRAAAELLESYGYPLMDLDRQESAAMQ
ncbi:hypothetical protein [Streptomyces tauricus]|uniref:hypothetical protein n=1 Tax=Streptomyces tauricus TaxID=68274 RepID=UPI0033BB2519